VGWTLKLKGDRSPNAPVILQAWPNEEIFSAATIVENSTYWWNLSGDLGSPFEVGLTVNGASLTRDIVSKDDIWFRWDIGFNAGFADLELTGLRGSPRAARIVVDPARNKLVRKDFRLMLGDIIADTRTLASTCGLHEGVSRGKHDLPIATLEYILESSTIIQSLVKELDVRHHKRLGRTSVNVPLRNAKGVTSAQWNRSRRLSRPVDGEVLSRLPERVQQLVQRSGGEIPAKIAQSKSFTDSNRREHAEILGFIQRLIAELRRAIQGLNTGQARDDEFVLQQRCRKVARRFTELLGLPVFNSIAPVHSRWQHSHLYQRVEPYRALYRIYRDVSSGVSGIDGDFTRIPLRETFRLYETWVSLRLARAAGLLDHGLDAASMFSDSKDPNRLTVSLRSTSVEFSGHVLKFKPIFNEVWLSPEGVGSYSRQMIPDVVLEVLDPNTERRRMVVLDAKYRVEAQLNDAISSIHMYKDSLIHENRSEGGTADKHIVGTGLVVVPSLPGRMTAGGDWRREKMPIVVFREGYQTRFKLGAMVLSPGTDMSSIAATLQGLIQSNRGSIPSPQITP
jgi:hypothetical protein